MWLPTLGLEGRFLHEVDRNDMVRLFTADLLSARRTVAGTALVVFL